MFDVSLDARMYRGAAKLAWTSSAQALPIVMDVEASGFGRDSYPIEIGCVMPDGRRECSPSEPTRDQQ